MAPKKKRRIEVEEWEEPLHPDPRGGNLAHALPQSNPICTFSPTLARWPIPDAQKVGAEQENYGGSRAPPEGSIAHRALQDAPPGAELQVPSGSVRSMCRIGGTAWGL